MKDVFDVYVQLQILYVEFRKKSYKMYFVTSLKVANIKATSDNYKIFGETGSSLDSMRSQKPHNQNMKKTKSDKANQHGVSVTFT